MNDKLRFYILERDKFTCQYCGKKSPDVQLEVDHLLPKKEGGGDNEENLLTACHACNRGKRDSIIGKIDEKDIDSLKKNHKKNFGTHVKIAKDLHHDLKMYAYSRGLLLQAVVNQELRKFLKGKKLDATE